MVIVLGVLFTVGTFMIVSAGVLIHAASVLGASTSSDHGRNVRISNFRLRLLVIVLWPINRGVVSKRTIGVGIIGTSVINILILGLIDGSHGTVHVLWDVHV